MLRSPPPNLDLEHLAVLVMSLSNEVLGKMTLEIQFPTERWELPLRQVGASALPGWCALQREAGRPPHNTDPLPKHRDAEAHRPIFSLQISEQNQSRSKNLSFNKTTKSAKPQHNPICNKSAWSTIRV